VIAVALFWASIGRNLFRIAPKGFQISLDVSWRPAAAAGGRCMTERLQDVQDADLRNLLRLISACTLGLWAFAAGILIGTFLFS
jgi:hypothetical protein